MYTFNDVGASQYYTNEVALATYGFAILTSTQISSISNTTAKSGGIITSDGGSPITARGIVWSTSSNPTVALTTKTIDGTGVGTFSSNLTGLTANTTYYVRDYAISSAGAAYGNQVVFITGSQLNENLNYGTLNDIDGNVYKTIQIGTQTWMAENLRTTKYRNGTSIPNYSVNGNTSGAWSYYDNNLNNDLPYGKLYSWKTISSSNQICPTSWHVPTDDEWNILIAFLGGSFGGTLLSSGGGQMKSTGSQFWNFPNESANNSSGFSGLPGGA